MQVMFILKNILLRDKVGDLTICRPSVASKILNLEKRVSVTNEDRFGELGIENPSH
jgi:hypothetical protein